MGTSVSLQGRFCHDMDPDSSILVSSLGYTEIIRVLSFSGAVLCIVMDCLFQFHYSRVLFWFDMDSTLCISVTLSGFTDTNWDHLRGLELRVD